MVSGAVARGTIQNIKYLLGKINIPGGWPVPVFRLATVWSGDSSLSRHWTFGYF